MPTAETPIRTFVAIELTPDLERAVGDLQTQLRQRLPFPAMRWVQAHGIHLTLKFLGDVPPSRLPAIQDTLDDVAAPHIPFTLAARDLGVFPSPSRPNVLWVGLAGDLSRLHRLRDAIELAIAPLGYPTEARPFHPHLTLARIKNAAPSDVQQVRDLLRQPPAADLGALPVTAIHLMRSDLSPQGARYTALGMYPLAGKAGWAVQQRTD